MDSEKARQVAADAMVDGVLTTHRLDTLREARLMLELDAMMHVDARVEEGGMLVLDHLIDVLTTQTREMEN